MDMTLETTSDISLGDMAAVWLKLREVISGDADIFAMEFHDPLTKSERELYEVITKLMTEILTKS